MKLFKSNTNEPFQNTILGIIVLGIFGSALWEKIISPLSTTLFFKISELISNFIVNWNNSLYSQIANAYHDSSYVLISLILYMFSLFFVARILIIMAPNSFLQFLRLSNENKKDCFETEACKDSSVIKERINKKKSFYFFHSILYLLSIIAIIFIYAYMLGRISYIKFTQATVLSNIEIVSPYIEDKEYKQLKSNFYSMTCEDDFLILINGLSEISIEHNIELKEIQHPFT